MKDIRVLILHRSRLLREALATALEKIGPFKVTGASPNSYHKVNQGLLELVTQISHDVILLNLDFPCKSGLSDASRILGQCPSARIILIGVPLIESEILSCIESGVAGCEHEDISLSELGELIKAVHIGEVRCSSQITQLLYGAVSHCELIRKQHLTKRDVNLTQRELEITELIERGLCNKEIAVYLSIEVQTVKNHVHNILDKLQLKGRHEVARYVRDYGLFDNIIGLPDSGSKGTST